jgi:hypothetical protein
MKAAEKRNETSNSAIPATSGIQHVDETTIMVLNPEHRHHWKLILRLSSEGSLIH